MRAAWALVGAALVFASGCAQTDWIDRTLVTVDVTGVWQGTFTRTGGQAAAGPGIGGDIVFVLQQQGAKVTGEMKVRGASATGSSEGVRIEGTVSGDKFSFHPMTGQTTYGEFQVNGDEMIGSWARLTTQTATLRRQQ
jgi:hypothetical protein